MFIHSINTGKAPSICQLCGRHCVGSKMGRVQDHIELNHLMVEIYEHRIIMKIISPLTGEARNMSLTYENVNPIWFSLTLPV